MQALLHSALRLNIAILLVALGIVVGGTWSAVKVTTDYLLYQNATSAARNWARLLAETVTDLEEIAAGEPPSNASMTFFDWAQKAGQVFRYEIYNRQGYSQLVSEGGVALVNLSEFSADAVHALATNEAVVDVREGDQPNRPPSSRAPLSPSSWRGRLSPSSAPMSTRPRSAGTSTTLFSRLQRRFAS